VAALLEVQSSEVLPAVYVLGRQPVWFQTGDAALGLDGLEEQLEALVACGWRLERRQGERCETGRSWS